MKIVRLLAGPVVLIALVVIILRQSLFSGGTLVPSFPNTDLHTEFFAWRYFGFTQWLHGHFPFWNPRVFCGMPFFAQTQSNLLYPISWVFFVLDVASASTVEMAANICVAALCTYCWARQRGISRSGSTFSGALYAFSGSVFLHIIPGHLSPLAGLAWIPMVFIGIDRILAERFRSGIVIGAIAICLQLLGGSPQFLYYAMLVGALYIISQSIGKPRKLQIYTAFIGMYLLAGMLSAVQLIPAYLAVKQTVRADGTSYDFASIISMPPESLLSILIPYPFGNMFTAPYLGRWYMWEMSAYIGLVSLVLSCIGISSLERKQRWPLLILLAAIVILMLGSYTPVHWYLYKYLPGFGSFRSAGKFSALWSLLMAIMAGHGFDRIRLKRVSWTVIAITVVGAAICFLLMGIIDHHDSPSGPVGLLLAHIARSQQFYIAPRLFHDRKYLDMVIHWMARQWRNAGLLLIATSLLLFLRRFSVKAAYFLLVLAIGELFLAMCDTRINVPLAIHFLEPWQRAIATAIHEDQRILFTDSFVYGNQGDLVGYNSIWGYDPAQPGRYTELIAYSQGIRPESLAEYFFTYRLPSRILQLLRCRYILQDSGQNPVLTLRDPMPHVKLIGRYVLASDPHSIPAMLDDPRFDFAHVAVLETKPGLAPTTAGATGNVRLVRQSINDLEIEADLPAPALLLITDSYAPGWHVRALERNPNQATYHILRADDVLRAIPLAAGRHHIDVYYVPPGLTAGLSLSAAAVLGLAVAAWLSYRNQHSYRTSTPV
ncbi:MAG TPA: hypothetical protein VG722_09630 [Tepidisphaeraceae bacterium]|nr:hypothetical protein [Tepidisphaeraceae bacterium]